MDDKATYIVTNVDQHKAKLMQVYGCDYCNTVDKNGFILRSLVEEKHETYQQKKLGVLHS